MKAYKVEVLILDFENYGADEIKSMFKNSRDIDGCVMAIREADIGTWSNDHPLNNSKTAALEYGRLFATPPSPSTAHIAEDERAAFDAYVKSAQSPAIEGEEWSVLDIKKAWLIWQAARRTSSTSIGEDGLPELPDNVAHVTRRIRRCESDVPAQVVFEHFARQYAREAIADDRRARGMVPSQMKEPSAGAASPQAAQGMSAADAVSLMLWLYRRLPRAYGRPPHVEMPIAAMAKAAGIDVADSFTERDPAPPLSSEQQAEKGDNACGS